jgi:NADPH:quinone reductase-like Zn-dependent oxidoreductase
MWIAVVLSFVFPSAWAFVSLRVTPRPLVALQATQPDQAGSFDRRELFQAAATCLALASLPKTAAAEDTAIGAGADHPIVVLGAGGKVGKLCIQILADKGLYTRAVTRSGRAVLDQDSSFVSYASGDVTKADSLAQALQGASGVIFAASASGAKKGGDPAHVDYLGAYNTARACLDNNVPKLVVISAGTATRPDSAGFKATNFFVKYIYGDNIMYVLVVFRFLKTAFTVINLTHCLAGATRLRVNRPLETCTRLLASQEWHTPSSDQAVLMKSHLSVQS